MKKKRRKIFPRAKSAKTMNRLSFITQFKTKVLPPFTG